MTAGQLLLKILWCDPAEQLQNGPITVFIFILLINQSRLLRFKGTVYGKLVLSPFTLNHYCDLPVFNFKTKAHTALPLRFSQYLRCVNPAAWARASTLTVSRGTARPPSPPRAVPRGGTRWAAAPPNRSVVNALQLRGHKERRNNCK